jgi:hypothetical protein
MAKTLAVIFLLLFSGCCLHETHERASCHLCPPEAPLAGRVLATSCRAKTLLVDIGSPGNVQPVTIQMDDSTVIIYQTGGRMKCEDLTAVSQIFIWPTYRNDLEKNRAIDAAVILFRP